MWKMISYLLVLVILTGGTSSIHASSLGKVDDVDLMPATFNLGQMKSTYIGDDETFAEAVKMISSAFIENRGQVDNDEVLYYTASSRGGFAFTIGAVLINLFEPGGEQSIGEFDDSRTHGLAHLNKTNGGIERNEKGYLLRLSFVDSNPNKPVGRRELKWFSNYFLGNDSSKWHTSVPNYQEIIYQDLWPGIDLIYKMHNGNLKYDFVIHPGSRPDQIKIKAEGDCTLSTDRENTLNIQTQTGIVVEDTELRIFYQNTQEAIEGQFHLLKDNIYTFILDEYNKDKTIIIDPLIYSTFLGGADGDYGGDITVDSNGYAYVSGSTSSAEFPNTTGAYDTTYNGSSDVFVTKLNIPGTSLIYSTFLGGADDEYSESIAIDLTGNAFLTGFSQSVDFPNTTNAYDNTLEGIEDVFVTKLNPLGNDLIYSTLLGGAGLELGFDIAVDSNGYAYITGFTGSGDFPNTTGAYDTGFNGGIDVFLTKLNPTGTDLIYSTFLGGPNSESGLGVVVDSGGYVYITGETYSSEFPTDANSYDNIHNGNGDVFVLKMNPDCTDHIYSTFLGGLGSDTGYGIALDSMGYAYITGSTGSSDFPNTTGAFDITYNGNGDAFVTKLNPSGTDLVYSTFIGGSALDNGKGIDIDSNGYVYITGSTQSADFPNTTGSFDKTYNGFGDGFISKLIPSGSDLVYSSFLGGANTDEGLGIAVDLNKYAYITGTTWSNDFPNTTGAFDDSFNSDRDVFVTKLDLTTVPLRPRNLQAVAGDVKVDLSWEIPNDDGGSPITNYTIYRGTISGGETFQALIGSLLTYADTNVTNGQMYYYKVSAINAMGEGPNSTEVNAKPLGLPSQPRDLQVSYGDSYVRLIWTEPNSNGGSPITNYRIHRGASPGSESYHDEIGIILEYNDTGLSNGITYYYQVSAVNAVGEGALSDEVSETPRKVPSEPKNLTAAPSNREITLTWNLPNSNGGSIITNYSIYRGPTSDSVTFLVRIGDDLTYVDSDLTNGQVYYYRIKALNEVGDGPLSNAAFGQPRTTPSNPANLTLSSGDEEIAIAWDSPDSNGGSEIISYRIYRGTSSGDLSFLIELGSDAYAYTDSGLANGITYYYQVSAVNAAGEGPNTTEVSEMPESLPQEKGFLEEFWWVLLLISMIVIIALVAVFFKRRKKREEDVGDGFKATAEPEGKVDTAPQALVVPKIKEIAREKPKGKMPSPETVKAADAIEMKAKSPATPKKVVKKPMQKVYLKKKVVRELATDKTTKKPVKERKENN